MRVARLAGNHDATTATTETSAPTATNVIALAQLPRTLDVAEVLLCPHPRGVRRHSAGDEPGGDHLDVELELIVHIGAHVHPA